MPDDTSDPDQPETRGRVARAVTAGAAAELAAHVLGVDWLASPLAPALDLGFRTIREADRRLYLQIAETLDVAIHETTGGAAEVERLALADPARTELFRRVVQAAGRSTLEEKIPALGRVLAAGLPLGDTVDEALFLAAGLADIEAPHAQILSLLAAGDTDGMQAIAPGYDLVLPAVLSALERHGLLTEVGKGSYGGGARHSVTRLGHRCLALLHEP